MNNIDRLKYAGYLMGELMTWLKKADDNFYISDLILEVNRFLKELQDFYDCDFKLPKGIKEKPIVVNITDEELEELRTGKTFDWKFGDCNLIIKNKNEE